MATAMESNPRITKLLFCNGENFCGFDIRPELTSNLTFLSAKNCEILVQNINICEGLQHELEKNGECESCWKTTLETLFKSALRNWSNTKQAKKHCSYGSKYVGRRERAIGKVFGSSFCSFESNIFHFHAFISPFQELRKVKTTILGCKIFVEFRQFRRSWESHGTFLGTFSWNYRLMFQNKINVEKFSSNIIEWEYCSSFVS